MTQDQNQQGKSLLEVKNLSVAYGKVEALSQFNMRVNEGQIVSVVGRKRKKKTTLLSARIQDPLIPILFFNRVLK